MIEGALPGHRLDAAYAGGDAALAGDLEQADVAGARHVRAAAQFGGVIAHLQHAHAFAVFFAEQRHRAEIQRFLHAHVVHFNRVVGAHLRIDLALDHRQFGGAHRLEVREVEAQPVRRDQRALLLHVGAQHLAQRGMQQVRGGMVEDGGAAAIAVDLRRQRGADLQAAAAQLADMAMELAGELLRLLDLEQHAVCAQLAQVADLAAGFGVERGAVEQYDRRIAGLDRFDRAPVLQQRDHLQRIGLQRVVAQEHGGHQLRHQIGRQGGAAAELAGRARGLALALHRAFEARHVDVHAALAGDVGGEIDREAIGVVQAERVRTRDAAAGAGGDLVEDLHARIQGLGKALLFGLQRPLHGGQPRRQFRIGLAHQVGQGSGHLVEERLAHAEHPAMAQGAADDPAQHVAAAFVGRQHAIDDQERAGANVVGDHAQRLVFQVGHACQLGGVADQRLEQVDLVVAVHVLQDRGQALQAHAGVHARRRQRHQGAVGLAVELHEHQVPDLDEAVAVLVRGTRGAAGDMRAVVVEDLGARTARAGVGHLPEVVGGVRRAFVVADAHDPLWRHPDHVAPQLIGLLVGVVDGDKQAFGGQLPDLGQQLPGPGDRLFFEVVAERPVAQHFEEGVMARGIADRIQVVVLAAGAQAALHVGRTHVAALLGTEEHVLELHHTGIGEQQRRVVARHQRRGRHDGVALPVEEFEEVAADLGGGEFGGCVHGLAIDERMDVRAYSLKIRACRNRTRQSTKVSRPGPLSPPARSAWPRGCCRHRNRVAPANWRPCAAAAGPPVQPRRSVAAPDRGRFRSSHRRMPPSR